MMVMKTMNFDPFRFSHGILAIQLLFLRLIFFIQNYSFLRLNGIFLEENRFMVVCVEEAFMDVLKIEIFKINEVQ